MSRTDYSELLYQEKRGGIGADTVLLIFLVIILAALVIFVSTTSLCQVENSAHGDSMNDTLVRGQYVLLNKSEKANPGDIIVFSRYDTSTNKSSNYIKRVIAVGGETIRFSGTASDLVTQKLVDGEFVTMPDEVNWIKGGKMGQIAGSMYAINEEVTIPNGEYFVMGDNRNNSEDSRRSMINMVKTSEVSGKVIYELGVGGMDEWLLKLLFSGGRKT